MGQVLVIKDDQPQMECFSIQGLGLGVEGLGFRI